MTDEATRAQIKAARPDKSTWLTANAGSGKTRVLTNRVARLLLRGVRPDSILCLTYTTAAASEMQNRLFKTLGSWAMLADSDLREALSGLGEDSPDDLRKARTLFASAIEAPGGLKIQTIHSFCSRILRQFPLEAGVNPQFVELDDAGQSETIRQAMEDLATADPKLIEDVRRPFYGDDLIKLAKDISRNAPHFTPASLTKDIRRALGIPESMTSDNLATDAITSADIAFLKSLIPLLRTGKSNDIKLADAFDVLPDQPSIEVILGLEKCLLTAKEPVELRSLPTKDLKESAPFAPLLARFVEIGDRVTDARRNRIALEMADATIALHRFAAALLPRYAEAKAAQGLLDFDDLIRLTRTLLTTRSLEWVLYRMDGRIEHILVDEAQDTSPMQWDVIEALTNEMTSGESDVPRTLFVVGDKKQSIYSFQGADTANFDARGRMFSERFSHGSGMAQGELRHSFRSSPAILRCVDAVFESSGQAGEFTDHLAAHDTMPGRVDVWPLVPPAAKPDEPAWHDPRPRKLESEGPIRLADDIASFISETIEKGSIEDKNGDWRPVSAGDFLILVQRRRDLFENIISACKAKGLDIAGPDVLKIGSELAVRDILALLSFLALPEDDLSLATALRSPLLGWSESALFDLAAHRCDRMFLWQELRRRRADFPETHGMLETLRERVDLARPFELIHMILTEFNGRRNLLQRIGPEAEDGIDELLNQALLFEKTNVPSLTSFLDYAKASEASVKREVDASGNLIRVMTVHGAKGLESPIVILPDTTSSPGSSGQKIILGPGGIPYLTQGREKMTPELVAVKDELNAADEAERDRLLYVAMTRAENWLVVCGVEPKGTGKPSHWHSRVEEAVKSLRARYQNGDHGFLRYATGEWQKRPERAETVTDSPELKKPDFASVPAPSTRRPLSPSDLGGDKTLPSVAPNPSGRDRGNDLHLLLEHLPRATDPLARSRALLARTHRDITEDEVKALCDGALDIIAKYPHLFDSNALAEVEITALVPSLDARISGAIDRLVVTDRSVLAVDFKTNALVPETASDVPEGILRQMGAYLEALEAIYPDDKIEVGVLWTGSALLMPLEHAIVRAALQRATTS